MFWFFFHDFVDWNWKDIKYWRLLFFLSNFQVKLSDKSQVWWNQKLISSIWWKVFTISSIYFQIFYFFVFSLLKENFLQKKLQNNENTFSKKTKLYYSFASVRIFLRKTFSSQFPREMKMNSRQKFMTRWASNFFNFEFFRMCNLIPRMNRVENFHLVIET